MNELIQITRSTINGAEVNSVNSREIYAYLEVKQQYADWIKLAIEKYDFIENEDFTLHKFVNGKATQKDYIVSLDMAKELCLVSNTEKGKETRKYFISVEKTSTKQLSQMEMIAIQAQSMVTLEKKQIEQDNKINEISEYIDEDIKTRPVSYQEQRMLQDMKMMKVYALGGDDEDLIKKLHSRVWSIFKKRFALPRYAALPASKFDEGVEFLDNLTIADMV